MFYLKQYGFWNWNLFNKDKLMKIYESQYNFIRKLNTILSSYTYINSLTKIEINNQEK